MSCTFCDAIKQEKEFEWYKRTTSSEDNSCEYVNNEDCSFCVECRHEFTIKGLELNGDIMLRLKYYQKVSGKNGDMVVDVYSESMQITFCPMCGERISKSESIVKDIPYPLELKN